MNYNINNNNKIMLTIPIIHVSKFSAKFSFSFLVCLLVAERSILNTLLNRINVVYSRYRKDCSGYSDEAPIIVSQILIAPVLIKFPILL
jgi:hypothetical protein